MQSVVKEDAVTDIKAIFAKFSIFDKFLSFEEPFLLKFAQLESRLAALEQKDSDSQ